MNVAVLCPMGFNTDQNLHTLGKFYVECLIKFQMRSSFNIHWMAIFL